VDVELGAVNRVRGIERELTLTSWTGSVGLAADSLAH
jgi:hypothetical protein